MSQDAFDACVRLADGDPCCPLCPPSTSCDLALARCGDGTCSPIEDYLICPDDCGP